MASIDAGLQCLERSPSRIGLLKKKKRRRRRKEEERKGGAVQDVITEYHRLGGLKQQTFIFHSSGGWEVQDQGAGRFGVW